MCGRPLCGGLNAFLHIAVISDVSHRKRNVVIFYIHFPFMKVFKKKKIIADFVKLSFACVS